MLSHRGGTPRYVLYAWCLLMGWLASLPRETSGAQPLKIGYLTSSSVTPNAGPGIQIAIETLREKNLISNMDIE